MQSGFWAELSSEKSKDGIRTMLNVSDALGNSNIVTDIPEEQIQKDVFLMHLIKQKNYQRCDSNYINKRVEGLNSQADISDLCATYMLDKQSYECDCLEKKYGVIALCPYSVQKRRELFIGDGFCLDKTDNYPQKYLTFKKQLQQPCNSMIIIDPYLCTEKKESDSVVFHGITDNLESLLDATLPESLDINFHLTIISSLMDVSYVKKVYEKIKKSIKRIRPRLNVKLGFVYTAKGFSYDKDTESFHSRHILTNSYIVDSEDGLDLFDENGHLRKNNPTLTIVFPQLFGDSRQDITKYNKWVNSVRKHVKDSPESLYFGTKENRLFDLVD